MWLRSCLPFLLASSLAACSAELPVAGAIDSGQTLAATVPEPAKPAPAQTLRCKTVLGEVEGFGKESVRSTAEKSRLKAIATETAHRKEIGQTVASVDLEATECVAVYPIRAEEWHCMARAKVCAVR
jgi:hypothetical protein